MIKTIQFIYPGLSHDQNMRKMRLLTFMQMAEVKKEIEYSLLQEEMMLTADEIEDFVIDGKFRRVWLSP